MPTVRNQGVRQAVLGHVRRSMEVNVPTALQHPLERHRDLERRWKRLLQRTRRPSVGDNTMPPRDPRDPDDDHDDDEKDEEDEDQHEEPPVIREPDEWQCASTNVRNFDLWCAQNVPIRIASAEHLISWLVHRHCIDWWRPKCEPSPLRVITLSPLCLCSSQLNPP
jgi:hypothetical protein